MTLTDHMRAQGFDLSKAGSVCCVNDGDCERASIRVQRVRADAGWSLLVTASGGAGRVEATFTGALG